MTLLNKRVTRGSEAANGVEFKFSVLQINCSGPARKLKLDKLPGAK